MSRWGSPIRPCGHRQHLAFIDSPPPISGTLLNVSHGLPTLHDGEASGDPGVALYRCVSVAAGGETHRRRRGLNLSLRPACLSCRRLTDSIRPIGAKHQYNSNRVAPAIGAPGSPLR